MGAKEAKRINVEIAPAVRRALEAYLKAYNRRADRSTPKRKYTDVINEALASYLDHQGVK
jgi:hypothetical protein